MFKILLIYLLLYCNVKSETYETWINIKNNSSIRFPLEKNNNGAFIEFLVDWINGPTGFWSQELLDRGFDDASCENKLCVWNYINGDNNNIELVNDDMYNENGLLAVKLIPNNSYVAIEQEIFYDDTTKLDIYIYAKSLSQESSFEIEILDLDENILESKLFNVSNEYQKYEFQSAVFTGNDKLKIRFSSSSENPLLLDEASVMPNNNVNGLRKEIYDIFAELKPGILRYPGGWHADLTLNKLENAIGPIDKRKSPLKTSNTYQRMDFGYHEYFQFIESLNIEPHIVVNLENGNSEEAANLVEYLNGDTNTEFGKKRVLNGYTNPYNVKIWEVGNEQWGEINKYTDSLKTFYTKMKEIDDDILIVANGDIWQGDEHYYKMDSLAGDKFDIYGYHPIIAIDTNEINVNNSTVKSGYLALMKYYEDYINILQNYNIENNNNHYFANTEWSHFIKNIELQYYDTTNYSSQFQTGLFNALMISLSLRNSNFHKMSEKTVHIGSIQRKIIDNKRYIYKKPAIVTGAMFSDHLGDEIIPIDNETSHIPKYTLNGENGFWVYDVPYTDVTVSASDDTTFIYIINRHIEDSVKVYLNNNLNYSNDFGKLYTYYQEDLQAELTFNDLNAFNPTEKEILISNEYIFPPHSFSILALPTDDALNIPQDELLLTQIITNNILETNNKDTIKSIQIFDLSGNKVEHYNILDYIPLKVSIEKLKIGTYVYFIEGNKENYKGKFLKSK